MDSLIRFGVSLPERLLKKFDLFLSSHGYGNRSEAIRDMIRQRLLDESWDVGKNACGVISLVYDHHQRNLLDRLTDIQHDAGEIILSSTHIHIDHHHCLEVIIVRGPVGRVKKLADRLIALKGVLHGSFSKAPTGSEY
ncbi:MAG: nickel-responsive transcriptional regulator NikR [Pseudomonadota bacterium]